MEHLCFSSFAKTLKAAIDKSGKGRGISITQFDLCNILLTAAIDKTMYNNDKTIEQDIGHLLHHKSVLRHNGQKVDTVVGGYSPPSCTHFYKAEDSFPEKLLPYYKKEGALEVIIENFRVHLGEKIYAIETDGFSRSELIESIIGLVNNDPDIPNSWKEECLTTSKAQDLTGFLAFVYMYAAQVPQGKGRKPAGRNKQEKRKLFCLTKHDPPKTVGDAIIHREKNLSEVFELLNGETNAVVISGMGGIGKTTLARAVYTKARQEQLYDKVGWLEYSGNLRKTLLNGLDLTANENEETDVSRKWDMISRRLRNDSSEKLLVIDGVDDSANDKNDIQTDSLLKEITSWQNLYIVLASRRSDIPGYEMVPVDSLSPDECEDLFFLFYDKDEYKLARENRHYRSIVQNLVKTAGYHTLTIELMAKNAVYENSLNEYSELVCKTGFHLTTAKVYTEHCGCEEEVSQQIRKLYSVSKISEKEKSVLFSLSLLPAAPKESLTLKWVDYFLGYAKKELLVLSKHGWISIKKGHGETNSEYDRVSMHPLIENIMHFEMRDNGVPPGTADYLIDKVLTSIACTWDLKFYEDALSLLPIKSSYKKALIFYNAATVARKKGLQPKAMEYYSQSVSLLVSINEHGDYDEELAMAYSDIGRLAMLSEGEMRNAEVFLREAYRIRSKLVCENRTHKEELVQNVNPRLLHIFQPLAEKRYPFLAELASNCDDLARILLKRGAKEEASGFVNEALQLRAQIAQSISEPDSIALKYACDIWGNVACLFDLFDRPHTPSVQWILYLAEEALKIPEEADRNGCFDWVRVQLPIEIQRTAILHYLEATDRQQRDDAKKLYLCIMFYESEQDIISITELLSEFVKLSERDRSLIKNYLSEKNADN